MQRSLLLLLALTFATAEARAEVWWLERKDFVHTKYVRIIGARDDRVFLSNNRDRLRISEAEARQISALNGYIDCPGSKFENGSATSAGIILGGRILMTAAHAIFDGQGRRLEPLGECVFRPKNNVSRKIRLMFDEGLYRLGSEQLSTSDDWLLVMLEEPVVDAEPFLITTDVVKAEPLLLFIALQYDLLAQKFHDEIIVSPCRVENSFGVRRVDGFLSDCDVFGGASGSLATVRRQGRLAVAGITIGGGPKGNYSRYDAGDGAYTVHIALGAHHIDMATSLLAADAQGAAFLAADLARTLSALSDDDRAAALAAEQRVLEAELPAGGGEFWAGGHSGVRGSVYTVYDPVGTNENCRTLRHRITLAGGVYKVAQARVCRAADGKWLASAQ